MQDGGQKYYFYSEFILGIKFLIENKILHVTDSNNGEHNIENIPQWIKNNADGGQIAISDSISLNTSTFD